MPNDSDHLVMYPMESSDTVTISVRKRKEAACEVCPAYDPIVEDANGGQAWGEAISGWGADGAVHGGWGASSGPSWDEGCDCKLSVYCAGWMAG